MTVNDNDLFEYAEKAREKAYAPYSKFKVGAALLDEKGEIHIGCNVENAAYPLGACAEAMAIGAMISQGGAKIKKIAIIGGRDIIEACTPCGGCRQKIAEFADKDVEILIMDEKGDILRYSMAELLPLAFRLTPTK